MDELPNDVKVGCDMTRYNYSFSVINRKLKSQLVLFGLTKSFGSS